MKPKVPLVVVGKQAFQSVSLTSVNEEAASSQIPVSSTEQMPTIVSMIDIMINTDKLYNDSNY